MPATPEKSLPKKPVKDIYMYWCHTDLPEDYFFVYGTSEIQVKRKYESFVGTGSTESVIAHKICVIPPAILKELKIKKICDFAEDELVLKAGIEYLHKDGSAFRYKGNIYRESGFLDDKYSEMGLSVYLFKAKGGMRFKVGHTTNVSRRLKELSKPDQLAIVSVIATPNAKKLETELLTHFKKFQIYNEYLELDDWGSFLLQAMFDLYFYEYSRSDLNHQVSDMFTSILVTLKQRIENHSINTAPSESEIAKAKEAYALIQNLSEAYYTAIMGGRR